MIKRRGNGKPVRVASLLPKVARSAFRKYGFAQASVVNRWREIVGNTLADNTMPVRLNFSRGQRSGGTLVLVAEGAFAIEVQHLEPRIVERINSFYGYAAVSRLQIRQGRVPTQEARKDPAEMPILSAQAHAELDMVVGKTPDSPLNDAIRRLGTRIFAGAEARNSATSNDPK